MKPLSPRHSDSMHETAPRVGGWRRWLRIVAPRDWLSPAAVPGSGLKAPRPSSARMELSPESPAKSWAAWEVSRRGRPAWKNDPDPRDSEQREG